jgi:hypothetical protein
MTSFNRSNSEIVRVDDDEVFFSYFNNLYWLLFDHPIWHKDLTIRSEPSIYLNREEINNVFDSMWKKVLKAREKLETHHFNQTFTFHRVGDTRYIMRSVDKIF